MILLILYRVFDHREWRTSKNRAIGHAYIHATLHSGHPSPNVWQTNQTKLNPNLICLELPVTNNYVNEVSESP